MPQEAVAGDVFAVRVAGLPAGGLDLLRCDHAWALAGEVLEYSAWLSAEGEALSDELYELIGRSSQPGVKPLLVGLRRAVYAGRRPDRPERALAAVPPEIAARVAAWLGRLDDRDELERELPPILAGELASAAGALRELAGDPGFRSGLAHSSPALCGELDKWIACPGAVPRRQVLARLARYAARVMTKTSPYATFTVSGLGRWSADGPVVAAPAGLGGQVVVAEFDLLAVWRLWEAIARRPELREAVTVRINPSLYERDGTLWFLAAGPGEALSSVPAVPAVRGVLAGITPGDDPRLGAVLAAAASPGSPALVDRLIEIGVLELRRPFADQAQDPLGDLLRWAEQELPAGSPDRPWLPDGLRALHQAVTTQREPSVGSLAAIGEMTASLLGRLGDTRSAAAARPCLHTAVSGRDLAVCGRHAWRPVLGDLQVLRRFLGLLDSDLPVKLTAAHLFTATYGPGGSTPFLDFYRLAHTGDGGLRALLHHEPVPDTPWPRELRELEELRRQAQETLFGSDGTRGIVTADPDLADKLASSWPGYIRPPGSICCYGQVVPGPGFVLNTIYSGYGRHAGRVSHLLARAGIEPPRRAPYPVIETLGAFGTGLNLRPPAAAGVDYPFTVTPGGLRLTDLRVRYDEQSTRLTLLDPGGRRLLPAHLGMTSELLLAPAWSFLIRVFGEPPIALPPSWPQSRPGGDSGPVQSRPRLALGSVTIRRARWTVPAAEFPAPGKGETDAAYLLRTARWLRRHEIPSRFFARIATPSARRPGGKERKPLYVDAASYFLLTSFARSIPESGGVPEGGGTVVLEEVLPDPADAPHYGSGGHRVTEYVLEISGDQP